MRFWDGFFLRHPIWTVLMSGFIGIAIYAVASGEEFENQNIFFI